MVQSSEKNFYAFTACSENTLISRVAEEFYGLCRIPDNAFTVFERGPGLYCTGRITDKKYRLLEWKQTPGFTGEDAFAGCWEEPTSLERLRALNTVSRRVTVHVALGHVPSELVPGLPKWALDGWRYIQKRRINAAKPDGLRETPWWRTICINPDTQTPDDVFFQLALILLQEQMIPQAQVDALYDTMVRYLCQQPWGCKDDNTARLVLDRLERHFIEPKSWRTLPTYIKRYLYWDNTSDRI